MAYYDVEDNVGLLYNTQYFDEVLACQYTDLLQCHNTCEAVTPPDDSENCVDAPTISQALKWLRDERCFHVSPDLICDYSMDDDGNICEEWTYWSYSIHHIIDGPIYRDYNQFDHIEYQSWEAAALEGITHVLDNLI